MTSRSFGPRPARRRALSVIAAFMAIAGCAAPAAQESQAPPTTPTVAPSELPSASATLASEAPTPTTTPQPTAAPVTVDELAQTTIPDLSVRTQPSTAGVRLGVLPAGETAFVIAGPVEADGYTWYQLGSPGSYSVADCGGDSPLLQCADWIGWAAGITPEGDRWIVPFDPDCPPGRDTTTYLAMDALTRLACAGNDEWQFLAYLAPPGGRGCFPVWLVDPSWMDPSCALFFPQPVESEFDVDTSLQAFIPPHLGICPPGICPELRGSWVEIVGHLDDPVAATCAYVLNSMFGEAPSLPPDPDLAVFRCRLNFVVTQVTVTTPPS